MESIVERFLRYVSYDTQSSEESDTFPSTLKQKELGKLLARELEEMGAAGAHMDEWGYVYATIPGNASAPAIGFIAHMDTATELSGKDVKPRIVHYEGGDIVLNEEKGIVMRAEEFECLQAEVGKDLIVTDGTTLLGADDKAGVAEIMEMAAHFLAHPEIPHGTIRIAFTPDEEVGGGPEHFDVPGFGADFGYTVDGGEVGSLNYENFNAASAVVEVRGKAIHPGSSKGKMINASLVAMEFDAMLPVGEVPALTEGYEGFHHLTDMQGTVESASLHYILRDHDRVKLEEKKARLEKVAAYLNDKYGAGTIILTLRDGYRNMREKIEENLQVVDLAKAAMQDLGIEPRVEPIRGGTDGCRLSFMGLPCPNLCAGGHNAHGKYEYVSVQSLLGCARVLIRIAEKAAE